MRTIILAGGYATRLHPLTLERAKPLLPVRGVPIITHILRSGSFPDRPIISTNRRFGPQFEDWKQASGIDADVVIEESFCEREKLGTIGAIAYVIETCGLDDDLLVIAGDNLFGFSLDRFLAAYRGHPLIALHDIGSLERVRHRYGVAIVDEGRVTAFQEKPAEPRSTLVSTACYVYPRDVLGLFKEFFATAQAGRDAPGYFNEWLLEDRRREIDPFVFEDAWFDIGDRASYIAAHRTSASDSWIDPSATIEDSQIVDSVVLRGAQVRSSTLRGCVVAEDCILSGVDLEDALIAENSRIAVAP